jgi:O-acetylserine/cysteine efflux transporter
LENTNNKEESNSHFPAFLAAGITLAFWSGTAIANKIAVGYMDGLTAGVLRSMIAGVLALIIAKFMSLPFPSGRKERLMLLLSGITSFAFWPMLLSLGIARTTAGHAALIMAMIPVYTVLIMAILNRKMPSPGWWAGAVIALLATAFLIYGSGFSSEGSSVTGDLIVLAGCLSCAVGYVAGGKLSPKIGTAATTFWGLSLALIVLVPVFSLIVERTNWPDVLLNGWLAIGWMVFLSSLAGYALWFYALGKAGISRISSLQLMMPVVTLLAAAIILGEALTLFLSACCVAVVIGTFLAQKSAHS